MWDAHERVTLATILQKDIFELPFVALHKKATIHQVTIMLATSKKCPISRS